MTITAASIAAAIDRRYPEQLEYLAAWLATPPRDREPISDWIGGIPDTVIDELETLDRPGRLQLAAKLATAAAGDVDA